MPKVSDAKTKSAPKPEVLNVPHQAVLRRLFNRKRLLGLLFFLCLLGLLGFSILGFIVAFQTRYDTLTAGDHIYKLLEAETGAAQAKGLGGRTSLPSDEGMVFIFGGQAQRCFWMKDMHFSLDMIWTDSNKQVVALEQNISPATYPESFCPVQPAQYVIELNAGQVHAAGIHVGQTLNF